MTAPRREAAAQPVEGRGSPHLEELTPATCRQLLAEHTVGRVGFHSAGGSVIIPVNYQMVNDDVVFRTSPAGTLAELRRRTSVAFEVDDIDEVGHRGWSVLVRGYAEVVTNDHQLTQLWQTGPVPWASGTRNLFVAIRAEAVTGRRIRGPSTD
jgi:nitroimidazol reductase NimA-like FMN-containing flavoprotein (pyridoxamine 5'-phosphate oxidase superfamily)